MFVVHVLFLHLRLLILELVVLGNLAQIDNKYISPLTSGLTYLVEKLKHYPHAGVMHVNGIVRSRLAAFAEENL